MTDAEAILGIGDWGTNGVDISVGKLMVYTGAAGIDPATVLPLVIDAGTNRKELLENPNYLGNRHERVRGDRYYDFIDSLYKQLNDFSLSSTYTGKISVVPMPQTSLKNIVSKFLHLMMTFKAQVS